MENVKKAIAGNTYYRLFVIAILPFLVGLTAGSFNWFG